MALTCGACLAKFRDVGLAPRASRPDVLNRKRPKDECVMKTNTKTTTKPAGFPKADAPQAFRKMAEKALNKPKKLTRK